MEIPPNPLPPAKYFNGFASAFGNSDMGLLLTCDEEIVVRVKASYTTMKTLALGLMELIDAFEKTTGRNVLTIADINTAMDSNHQEGLIRGQRI